MNTRLVPASPESPIKGVLGALSTYRKLARFVAPEGIELFSGRRNGRPLAIGGHGPTVLCIHGYCGGPEEVAVGVEVARRLGLPARAPVLPGHGGRPQELSPLRFEDWFSAVKREFDQASRQGPVILLGLSLGSLLATQLVLSRPESVKALVMMANAFWLKNPLPGALLSLADWLKVPDFGYPTPEKKTPSHALEPRRYHVQPVRGAISVKRAGERLRGELPRVTCPTLILHGARDEVCSLENAHRVFARLGSEEKRVVVFPESRHVMSLGTERAAIAQEIEAFLKRFGR